MKYLHRHRIFASALLISFYGSTWANFAHADPRNVVVLVLEGVRPQEFFQGPDPALAQGDTYPAFPVFWSKWAQDGVVLGDPSDSSPFLTGSPGQQRLPIYQELFSGKSAPCMSSFCGYPTAETLPERLKREFNLEKTDVATIASWDKVRYAAEHKPLSTFINAGFQKLPNPMSEERITHVNDALFTNGILWPETRADRYTMSMAMLYLMVNRPRFLFIALNNADRWASQGDYGSYLTQIREYDRWINTLLTTLGELGDYGEQTAVFITSAHGRGDRPETWRRFDLKTPGSDRVFLYAYGPGIQKIGTLMSGDKKPRSHDQIRATIEKVYGLSACDGCAEPLNEIFE